MTIQFDEARSAVRKAREALQNNDRTQARQLAEQAAALAPQMEDPWLILAAIASPHDSLEYIQKALKINPESPRAQRGMQWATQRLNETTGIPNDPPGNPSASVRKGNVGPSKAGRSPLLPILLFGLGCLICAAAGISAALSPALASLLNPAALVSVPTQPQSWAEASIPKPTYTPNAPSQQALSLEPRATPTDPPTDFPTDAATSLPTDLPTDLPTQLAISIDTAIPSVVPNPPGSITLQYVPDTLSSGLPTSIPQPTFAPLAQGPAVAPGGTRWIDVDLSKQTVYAYEGNSIVNTFLVSTGTALHPTVTGQYHIYVKLLATNMTGPGYFLPNVPFTMYFYKGYGLHGTYWHHNFGHPMSHGCVNLRTSDAQWLFDWASVGTLVNVHN